MTTLREKIERILHTSPETTIDAVMQAIKSKYGWDDEDCPFSFGDEIEVTYSHDIEGAVWDTDIFRYYDTDLKKYWCDEDMYSIARPIQKEEPKKVTLMFEMQSPENLIVSSDSGKKYKLVEVE